MNKTYFLGEGLLADMHWRGFTRQDITNMSKMSPLRLENLLESLGWVLASNNITTHTWQKLTDNSFNQVTIPIATSLQNYAEMMLYAVYDVYLYEDITKEELCA